MADPSRPPVTGYPAPSSDSAYYAHSGAAANGYPYPATVAPPPHQNYAYAYHYDPASVAASRAAFLRRMISVMIAFFVVSASIVFIIWLVLRPRLPKFSIDTVAVSNLNLSSPSPPATQSAMSGDWSVGFAAYNPNKKMSIAFDDLSAELLYRSAFLSETRIPPFDQDTKDRTAVNATFSAKNSYVENWVVTGINGDRGRGTVSFDIRVWARVGFRSGGWRLRRRLLRVHCEGITVKLSAGSGSGKLNGGPRECRVGV